MFLKETNNLALKDRMTGSTILFALVGGLNCVVVVSLVDKAKVFSFH